MFLKMQSWKGCVAVRGVAIPSQLLQSCHEINVPLFTQGFKANPGLELSNAFSVVVHSQRRWHVKLPCAYNSCTSRQLVQSQIDFETEARRLPNEQQDIETHLCKSGRHRGAGLHRDDRFQLGRVATGRRF